jgi:hypothetical protein
VLNNDIRSHNAEDPIGGFQGIPVNMSTIAGKLALAGYESHAVGKWCVAGSCPEKRAAQPTQPPPSPLHRPNRNAGMATKRHTPVGRGYKSGLTYFDVRLQIAPSRSRPQM